MSSPKFEVDSYSRVYIRILYFVIVLQLVIGTSAWLEFRSLRKLDAKLLDQHSMLIYCREQLAHVRESIRAFETNSSKASLDAAAQRAIAAQLSFSLVKLSEVKTVIETDELASAREQSGIYHEIAIGVLDTALLKGAVGKTASDVEHWDSVANRTDLEYQHQGARTGHDFFLVSFSLAITPLFVLAGVFCATMIRRDARRQSANREAMEDELRRERSALEKRIETRTMQLQSEVTERQRAEQLNRGRNQMLEMIAREEPAQGIFQVLADVIAKDRSRWGCALHLIRNGELCMEASSGLPANLLRNLQQLDVTMADAPEALALREQTPQVLEDLSRERRPWTQLLFANGIQSMWSTPILGADKRSLGTLTIYSLLRSQPTNADWEFLESNSQMAAMVLERYRLQEELRRHAYHDSLTGLPNRLLGEEQLSSALRRSSRNGSTAAVLWIDLNKFKQINDVHGHSAGDAVLVEVAGRLSGRLRDCDTIARMGGDEFMAILEGVVDRAAAQEIAEQLLSTLAAPIAFEQLMLSTAASIGVSMFPEDGESAELLERNADMAMYEAKFGNHGVRTFSPALDSILSERLELEKSMSRALESDGFALHYQPQYDRHGELAGFEALLRLPHPLMGLVSPARIIPIAEESEMIVALGNWVLKEACTQSLRWQEKGYPPVLIAVNVSGMQFVRGDFADQVAEVLRQTGLRPELLELELTESVMVKDFAESTKQLQRLKSLGISIAVDDFGTGYSSLNRLHRLPIDRLKIDRSFIQSLNEPNGTLPIVESIISMAHRMGMLVIAEGVETKQQKETLCRNGCDLLQGYLLSVPLSAERAVDLFEAKSLSIS